MSGTFSIYIQYQKKKEKFDHFSFKFSIENERFTAQIKFGQRMNKQINKLTKINRLVALDE